MKQGNNESRSMHPLSGSYWKMGSTKIRGHPERMKKRHEIHKKNSGSPQDYGPNALRMMTWSADPESKQFIWD